MALGRRKLVLVVTALAVIGVIVGIVVWQTSGSSSSSSTKSSDSTSDAAKSSSKTDTSGSSGTVHANSSASSAEDDGTATKITSDPAKETFTLSAYAIGDWGSTIERASCCKRRAGYVTTNFDKNAEDVVATLMGKAAAGADPKPKAIISHGDNFYWVGIIDDTDKEYRFDKVFEKKFNAPSLAGIPWINVMGGHDYGGASYICSKGGTWAKCNSPAEVVAGLKKKFDLQASYKSPNGDRWVLKDHFYVHTIKDEASGVSMDIFNIDINDADSHGAQEICCQCYSYSDGKDESCKNVVAGDAFCAGGDVAMYKACFDQLNEWGDESRAKLKEAVAKSTATWKVVNAHYSPYTHYAEARLDMWSKLLKSLDVQLFIYGHTHGEKHDFASYGMHFIENGAGGGILFESASSIPPYVKDNVKELWSYGPHQYGFFDLYASKEWLRARFVTYDDAWNVQDAYSQSTIGGIAYKHCWYIPVDGSKGKKCDS